MRLLKPTCNDQLTPSTDVFWPMAMTTNGEFIFIVGTARIGGGESNYFRIEKRDLDGLLQDQYDEEVILGTKQFRSIVVSGEVLYIGGNSGYLRDFPVIQCRDVDSLAAKAWEYTYQSSNYGITDLALDNADGLYFVGKGTRANNGLIRGKLIKTSGLARWAFTEFSTICAAEGCVINAEVTGANLYVTGQKNYGFMVSQINPTTGTEVSSFIYGAGTLTKGCIATGSFSEEVLFTGGYRAVPVAFLGTDALVQAVQLPNSILWQNTASRPHYGISIRYAGPGDEAYVWVTSAGIEFYSSGHPTQTVPFATYTTLNDVVSRIESLDPNFTANIGDMNGTDPSNQLAVTEWKSVRNQTVWFVSSLYPSVYNYVQAVCDGNIPGGNVYAIGQYPWNYVSDVRIVKISGSTGAEVWGSPLYTPTVSATAICEYGDYFYIAGYDSAVDPWGLWLQKRSKSDGALVWAIP
jgi:hypothetical protein